METLLLYTATAMGMITDACKVGSLDTVESHLGMQVEHSKQRKQNTHNSCQKIFARTRRIEIVDND